MSFRMDRLIATVALLMFFLAGAGFAGPQSLMGRAGLGAPGAALIPASLGTGGLISPPRQAPTPRMHASSLFSDRNSGSLFELVPRETPRIDGAEILGVVGLRKLIASAEAGKAGYDAVQHGAFVRPEKPPTRMTIREIYAWIDRTPGQPHAIGRYQMIPKTLRRLVRMAGLDHDALFSPRVQDQLGDLLLEEAGLSAFLSGELSQTGFMNNLAKIWAGLPNSSGKSHYHGYAGNRATMTWAHFEASMNEIFRQG